MHKNQMGVYKVFTVHDAVKFTQRAKVFESGRLPHKFSRPHHYNLMRRTALKKNKPFILKKECAEMFQFDLTSRALCSWITCVSLKLKEQSFFPSVGFRHISYDLLALLPFTGIDMTSQ